jgi:glycosyltransferase involved in cell wall biosynthesis
VSERTPVLYLAPWVDVGGADRATVDWFAHLDRERFAASLICTQPSPNRWLDRVVPYAEEVWVLPEVMSGRDFPDFILGFVATRGIRVVHLMHSRLGYDLLPDLRLLPDPPAVVAQFHLLEPDRTGYVPYVLDRYVDLVDGFSVVSRHLAQALRDGGVPDARIHVIPLGVDADREWNPGRVAPIDLENGRHQILWPGRLVEQKDPLLAVEVAAALRDRDVAFTLHMLGDGHLEGAARARAADLGLGGQVAWHPPSRDIARWYRACDLVLMTSSWEGIPYVLYESLAMATPLVAPALPGNVELLDDDAGALVPVSAGAAAYAEAIAGVLADADRHEAAARARERVRRDHRVDGVARAHEDLYRRLAPPPPAVTPVGDPPPPLRFERPQRVEPTVAVIVACYDHGRYLPFALGTLAEQELAPSQVIVVDDGSQDLETVRLLDELEERPDLEVLRLSSNVGLGAARNAGLERVRSNYVLPLDADDGLDPCALARMVSLLEAAEEDVGFVYPNYQHFGTREDLLTVPAYNLALLRGLNYCHASSLFDRRVFDAGLRYRAERESYEDWELVLDLAERGVRGVPAPGRTLLYRKRGFSLVDARRLEGRSPEEGARLRHPSLYDPRRPIKARWAPALSVIAIPGTWDEGLLAEQSCVDFEVLCEDDPGWGCEVVRSIDCREGPGRWLQQAVDQALGRFVLVAAPGCSPALARRELVEHVLRCFAHSWANGALGLARTGGRPLAALQAPLPAELEVVGVAWERTPEAPWAAIDLGLTGSHMDDLLVGVQSQRPVWWWSAG